MMLPGEESALARPEYEKLLLTGTHLLNFALSMTAKEKVRMKEEELGFMAVVLGLYAKSVKTFRAIHLLCVHGLCEDAETLLRTLAEVLADIKYLAKEDREDRAEKYLDFTVIQDQKLINATEQNPKLQGMFPDDVKAIVRQRIDGAKARMNEEEFEERYKASAWHGRPIEQIMREVGMQSVYDLPFRQGSRAAHATDLFDHIEWKPENGFTLKLIPGDKWAGPVLGASNLFFLEILKEVNAIARFGEDEEIRSITEEVVRTHAPPTAGSDGSEGRDRAMQ